MIAEDIRISYSKRLRELRKKRGYTQQKLAERANVEYKHIQRLESKKPCDVRITTMKKIAKALNIPLSEMLDF